MAGRSAGSCPTGRPPAGPGRRPRSRGGRGRSAGRAGSAWPRRWPGAGGGREAARSTAARHAAFKPRGLDVEASDAPGWSAWARCDQTATTSHFPLGLRPSLAASTSLRPVGRHGAVATQPGVGLEVHPAPVGRPGVRRRHHGGQMRPRRGGQVDPRGDGGREVLVGQGAATTAGGAVDARPAQRHGFVESADAEPGAPAVERRVGDRDASRGRTRRPSPRPSRRGAGASRARREAPGRCAASRRRRATLRLRPGPSAPDAGAECRPCRHLPFGERSAPARPRTGSGCQCPDGPDRRGDRVPGSPTRGQAHRRPPARPRGACRNAPAARRPPRLEPGGQECADDPGQHVAGTRRGRPRRRRRVTRASGRPGLRPPWRCP